MPDGAIRRIADIHAAVVAFLVGHLEAPFDVKDAVGNVALEQEHLVVSDAIADQRLAILGHAPGRFLLELAFWRNGDSVPVLQVLVEKIDPSLWIGFKDALLVLSLGRSARERHESKNPPSE